MSLKKQQILDTAILLFNELGVDKTPTARIAREANVATGTLFHHFKTKVDLINGIYLSVKKELFEHSQEEQEAATNIKESMRITWANIIEWCVENPIKFQFVAQFSASPYITKLTRQQIEDDIVKFFYKIIDNGKHEGILRELPTELIYEVANGIISTTAFHFIANPEQMKNNAVVEEAFDTFWKALAR